MKILVVGCGSIGQRHIRNLLSIKAGHIFAFDVDAGKESIICRLSPKIIFSTDFRRLLGEKPEVVFICTPTALHLIYALKAAKQGCHLFIEKPLSHNLRGLHALIRIAKYNKLVTFVGYNYRFNDCIIRTKKFLENDFIGKVIGGRFHFGSYLPARHPQEDYRVGYGARRLLGGGVVLDALSHQLDTLIFLLGQPKKAIAFTGKTSSLDIDVEDIAEILLKFSARTVLSLHANFLQRPYQNSLELIGEKGTIICDFVTNSMRCYDIGSNKWTVFQGDKDANVFYVREIRYFLKCVREKYYPPVELEKAVKEVRILLKIKNTTARLKWIKV